jgi:hypothetical protein
MAVRGQPSDEWWTMRQCQEAWRQMPAVHPVRQLQLIFLESMPHTKSSRFACSFLSLQALAPRQIIADACLGMPRKRHSVVDSQTLQTQTLNVSCQFPSLRQEFPLQLSERQSKAKCHTCAAGRKPFPSHHRLQAPLDRWLDLSRFGESK